MGRRLGDADDPLLVSVRSGAKFSMPGMMETVLDIGLNDESVAGAGAERAAASGSPSTPTAGCCRCSAPPCSASTRTAFAAELDKLKAERGVVRRRRPRRRRDLRGLVATYQAIIGEHTGRDFPQDPREQLRGRRAAPSSRPGTPSAPCSTAARSGSPTTSAPPSTCRPWSSATAATGLGLRASASPATRRPVPGRVRRLPRRRPGRGRRRRHPQHRPARRPRRASTSRRTTQLLDVMSLSSGTTATCATSSSPSRTAGCGSCRPGSASAPPRRRSGSPGPWSTRG